MANIFDQARTALKNLKNQAVRTYDQNFGFDQGRFNAIAQIRAATQLPQQQALQYRQQVDQLVPRLNVTQNVQNPYLKFGAEVGQGLINTFPNAVAGLAKLPAARNFQQGAADLASFAEAPLSLTGFGVAKNIGLQGLKQAGFQGLKQTTKQGAKTGAIYGGIFGGTAGLREGEYDSLGGQLGKTALGIGTGATLGGLTGGLLSGAGYSFGTVVNAIKRAFPKAPEPQVRRLAQKFIRDEAGRFAKGPGKKKEPVYYGDIRESLGLPRDGDYKLPQPGLSIKYVKDKGLEGGGVKVGKLPQSVEAATTKITLPESKTVQSVSAGGGQPDIPGSPSSSDIIDPIQKVINALKEAKPIRGQQEKLYAKERAIRAARVAGAGERVGGEKGYFAQLGQLKGELPKVQFESIRKQLKQPDIDSLFNKVEQTQIFSPFEKVTAKGGLAKLLGAEGGAVPTEGELKLLNEIFPPEFIQAVMGKRPLMQRLWTLTEEVLNLPRAVMSTLDLSAPLRQGVFLVGRPKQWVPAFGNMFKYALSEKSYDGLTKAIQSRPTYKLMRQSKLALTDMTPVLGSREEAFMSNLAEKIPGFGKLARASNRAYSGFLNKLRADTFDDLYKTAQQLGLDKERPQVIDDIASFVNSATGRGKLPGAVEKAAVALNSIFFSPRLMASRLNLLSPVYYAKLDPFVRKEALKSLFTFTGTALSVLTLTKLGGADVSADPRSADFGKIKVGNIRYDVLGGFQQYLRVAGQLTTGQKINTTTGKLTTLGEGYGAPNRKDILYSFFESKTAPIASFAIALLRGQNAIGAKPDIPTELINRFIPMIAQDMYDISKESGSPLGAVPGLFGVGTQTYGKNELTAGINQLGEQTTQLRPVPDLGQAISEKLFGQQPLDKTKPVTIFTEFQKLKTPQEKAQLWDQLVKNKIITKDNITEIKQLFTDEQLGVTPEDQLIKTQGVEDGTRAKNIAKEFKKLKTPEEKAALWDKYVKAKIITKDVAKQLKTLLNE